MITKSNSAKIWFRDFEVGFPLRTSPQTFLSWWCSRFGAFHSGAQDLERFKRSHGKNVLLQNLQIPKNVSTRMHYFCGVFAWKTFPSIHHSLFVLAVCWVSDLLLPMWWCWKKIWNVSSLRGGAEGNTSLSWIWSLYIDLAEVRKAGSGAHTSIWPKSGKLDPGLIHRFGLRQGRLPDSGMAELSRF